jgi:coenzyme F420-reducing hydrogenase beta subunit/polysaccharide pyruvyl transferase WcaK-like protein
MDIDPSGLRKMEISSNLLDGPCLKCYTAYSKDLEIRENSTSGGLITNLILELLKYKEFDEAFVLPFNKFGGQPARLVATNKRDEILCSAKSKYIPASVFNVISELSKSLSRRYIIVSTPCLIHGIKKYMNKYGILENDILFLGLFCDKTLNFNILRFFEDNYKKRGESLIEFQFRTKEKAGWPGNSKVRFDSGREIIIDKTVRMQLKRYFQLNRCRFCLDKLNRQADIAFGDCYIRSKNDFYGKSSVIIRTEKGRAIFDKYSHLFVLESEDIEEIRKAEDLVDRIENLMNTKVLIAKQNIYPDSVTEPVGIKHKLKSLLRFQEPMYIGWGKSYKEKRIKYSLFLSKIYIKLRTLVEITGLGMAICEGLFAFKFKKRRGISGKTSTGNIIIVGGEPLNKGSQAMMFTVLDQMKKRFPDRTIYSFSTLGFQRRGQYRDIYEFESLPWEPITKIRLLGWLGKSFVKKGTFFEKSRYPELESETRRAIKNADFMVDISGYYLSSQHGFLRSASYLINIMVARKYSIPYYILPQSIGPFDYPTRYKFLLYPLMKLCLSYPQKIFAREKEGVRCLRKFTRKNVEQGHDIVLESDGHDLANIDINKISPKGMEIGTNSVGVIPNLNVIKQGEASNIYSVYRALINKLLNANKTVYLLRHSYEDSMLCESIKRFFPENEDVKLIYDELNTFELENVIAHFDFIIGSRYHGIVHAYRNGVPALVIGWATKYFELLEYFHQLDYLFDCRSNIEISEVSEKLDKMMRNYESEREVINNRMIASRREPSVFDIFNESCSC